MSPWHNRSLPTDCSWYTPRIRAAVGSLDELTQPGFLGEILDSNPEVIDQLVTGLVTSDTDDTASLRE